MSTSAVKLLHLLFALLFLFPVFGCDSGGGSACDDPDGCDDGPTVNVVLLYGSHTCGACTSLASALTTNDIEHTFLDVNEDQGANQEMHDKMEEAYPGQQVAIPVVDVNGVILDSPTVLQVKKYLWENQETE